jgi:molecular chaperone Hsp33
MMLLQSCTDEELLSSQISAEELLFRLFHEEGVRVFEAKPVQKNCRCSMEKVEGVLTTLSDDDIRHLTVDGKVSMTCEFCSREFALDPVRLGRNIA